MSQAKVIPVVVGVAGGTGSGKTTVATEVVERVAPVPVTYLQHDSYYRDRSHLRTAERAKVNYDHPDALETELLAEHVRLLRSGETVEVPIYDFTRHTRLRETRREFPNPVILVEGMLLFVERDLRELFDIKIFVDTDADIRFIRRLRRDVAERGRKPDAVIQQYLTTVRPMHLEFVEPSKRYADVIIPEGGFNRVALDMVVARIRETGPINPPVEKPRFRRRPRTGRVRVSAG